MTEIAIGRLVLERYRIERRLGMGSFGTVWLAEDVTDGERIALKVLHPQYATSTITRGRFEREAKVLLDVRHPSIASAKALHQEGELLCYALELVEGQALDRAIGERTLRAQPFTLAEVAEVFEQLCGALAHAHAMGVVHRDLKPSNVMVSEALRVKVLDFGLVKLLDGDAHDATTRGRRIGSMMYMSPEQIRSEPIDARGDVFALGTMLYELLTLERAWAVAEDGGPIAAYDQPLKATKKNTPTEVFARIIGGPRPRPSLRRPGLPVGLDAVIAKATAIDLRERYEGAEALLTAIHTVLADELAFPTNPSTRPQLTLPGELIVDTRVQTAPSLATPTQLTPPRVVDTRVTAAPDTRITPGPRRRWGLALAGLVGAVVLASIALWPRAEVEVIERLPSPPPHTPPAISARASEVAPVATEAPSASPSPLASPRATPRPVRSIAPKPSASSAPIVASPEPSPKPYPRLWALLRDARQSSDPSAIRQLGELIAASATADVGELPRRQKILRLAESSSMVGDLAGLELALTLLSERK